MSHRSAMVPIFWVSFVFLHAVPVRGAVNVFSDGCAIMPMTTVKVIQNSWIGILPDVMHAGT